MVVYKVTVITKNDHQPTLSHRPDPFRPLFSIFGILALCFGLFLCFGLCLCFSFVFQAMLMFRVCVSGMGFGFCFGLVLCFELWFFCFLFLFFFTGFDGHSRVCGCAVIFMGLMVVVVVHGRVSKLQEHPWQIFTYISVGVGPLPMRFGLNLKYTHEIGISTRP